MYACWTLWALLQRVLGKPQADLSDREDWRVRLA